ncbi:head-tail adaptor protein [Cyclobacterium plantarum]|uniref:Head-tail adaptor protein n=1 Tax=Cyclobacterium plantarum TaxID=2716263 RepID=A0ABX0H855_9BACT|nr:head-tail adaptor protein [Cyclobacterium plantarum]NHE57958.1 head-tail adaptor protein [Cyclobacterium plantarum]
MIQLSDLRYKISIYYTQDSKGEFGQPLKVKQHYSDFFASKYDWQNREKYENSQLIESDIIIFTIYYDGNINTSYTIEFEGKEYNIKGVKEIGYREGLEITAQYKNNR